MSDNPVGLMIAGTQSGVGKTTLTLGLMAAMVRRGLRVQPFKVGPDFIDPGHHTHVAGRVSRNLDGWMLDRETNRRIFGQAVRGADVAVVEGVMGLFDGYDGASEAGSTAQMAKWLGLPVLLVTDVRSMARSVAALVHGFTDFDPEVAFAGVLCNRVGSDTHFHYIKEALASVPSVPCLGGIPRDEELFIPERHLGLVTDDEHRLDAEYLKHLADLVEKHIALDRLLDGLPVSAPTIPEPLPPTAKEVRIGVAADPAFCFYYQDNLDLLERAGAEIVRFSPIRDRNLPAGLDGLYLGGGYPEVFAASLAQNGSIKNEISRAAEAGMPVYAECGGFMYLCAAIEQPRESSHAMAGVFPWPVTMLPRRRALGYREVTFSSDCILGPQGTSARGHEFHYSDVVGDLRGIRRVFRVAPRNRSSVMEEGYSKWNVLGGYIHLHFGSNPLLAEHFVDACRKFKRSGNTGGPRFSGPIGATTASSDGKP